MPDKIPRPGGRRRRRRGCIAPSPGKISFCWTCLERPGGRKPQGRRYLQDYGYELRNEQYKIKPYSLTVYIQSLSQWKVFIDKNSVSILRSVSINQSPCDVNFHVHNPTIRDRCPSGVGGHSAENISRLAGMYKGAAARQLPISWGSLQWARRWISLKCNELLLEE